MMHPARADEQTQLERAYIEAANELDAAEAAIAAAPQDIDAAGRVKAARRAHASAGYQLTMIERHHCDERRAAQAKLAQANAIAATVSEPTEEQMQAITSERRARIERHEREYIEAANEADDAQAAFSVADFMQIADARERHKAAQKALKIATGNVGTQATARLDAQRQAERAAQIEQQAPATDEREADRQAIESARVAEEQAERAYLRASERAIIAAGNADSADQDEEARLDAASEAADQAAMSARAHLEAMQAETARLEAVAAARQQAPAPTQRQPSAVETAIRERSAAKYAEQESERAAIAQAEAETNERRAQEAERSSAAAGATARIMEAAADYAEQPTPERRAAMDAAADAYFVIMAQPDQAPTPEPTAPAYDLFAPITQDQLDAELRDARIAPYQEPAAPATTTPAGQIEAYAIIATYCGEDHPTSSVYLERERAERHAAASTREEANRALARGRGQDDRNTYRAERVTIARLDNATIRIPRTTPTGRPGRAQDITRIVGSLERHQDGRITGSVTHHGQACPVEYHEATRVWYFQGKAPASQPHRLTCPTCRQPNARTPQEAARGYQCRACTRRDES